MALHDSISITSHHYTKAMRTIKSYKSRLTGILNGLSVNELRGDGTAIREDSRRLWIFVRAGLGGFAWVVM